MHTQCQANPLSQTMKTDVCFDTPALMDQMAGQESRDGMPAEQPDCMLNESTKQGIICLPLFQSSH